jgi:hypothetical protein
MKEGIPAKPLQPKNGEAPMDRDEAQLEADMLRIKVQEMVGHEPTAEDYDRALQAIEEMREKAANEPEFSAQEMLRIGSKYFEKGLDTFGKIISFGRLNDPELHERRMHMYDFDSARAALEHLKEKVERLPQ